MKQSHFVDHDWVAYDPLDVRTHPEDGALIEARYENGSHGKTVYLRARGGISRGFAFNVVTAPTRLKLWRYE